MHIVKDANQPACGTLRPALPISEIDFEILAADKVKFVPV